MYVSVFDIFKLGVGPSSSHTVGPMKAAYSFVTALGESGTLSQVARVQVDLYGSLALTGRGHATDTAILQGLAGQAPDRFDADAGQRALSEIRTQHRLALAGRHPIHFAEADDLRFHMMEVLPRHTNGLRLTALDKHHQVLASEVYYSIGGGFIVTEAEFDAPRAAVEAAPVPYAFDSAAELLMLGDTAGLSIPAMMWRNESALRPEAEVQDRLMQLASAMRACIARGLETEGELPGGLHVRRRAPALKREIEKKRADNRAMPTEVMDWVSLYAIAVNEENAAGGQVVTAPTNGAAGIVPAVLEYYLRFCPDADDQGVIDYLLTAGAIGALFKTRASISGAEVGCQGEVGVACSMAAAGLAAALGGTNGQIENAAEIGMEHHLGLTCDPVGGLVQIPCIERNAMGALKAISAASLALKGDGTHKVSLDMVIETMRQTGQDMMSKYKETAQGGLAVNVVEC